MISHFGNSLTLLVLSWNKLYEKELTKKLRSFLHIAGTSRFDGSLIPSQNCQLEWMIYCGGPICLGQGYNMPRERGKEGGTQFLKITLRRVCCCRCCSLHPSSGRVQRVWCKILGESSVFNVNIRRVHSRWPENIQRAVKYPGIGIPISAIEKWRNVATGGVLYCDGRLSRWIESG